MHIYEHKTCFHNKAEFAHLCLHLAQFVFSTENQQLLLDFQLVGLIQKLNMYTWGQHSINLQLRYAVYSCRISNEHDFFLIDPFKWKGIKEDYYCQRHDVKTTFIQEKPSLVVWTAILLVQEEIFHQHTMKDSMVMVSGHKLGLIHLCAISCNKCMLIIVSNMLGLCNATDPTVSSRKYIMVWL